MEVAMTADICTNNTVVVQSHGIWFDHYIHIYTSNSKNSLNLTRHTSLNHMGQELMEVHGGNFVAVPLYSPKESVLPQQREYI